MSESNLQDLLSARALLDGFTVQDKRGRQRHKYLKAGSPKEAHARRALVGLLLGNALDHQLRTSLAELFDPDPPSYQQRKITFVNRGRGKLRDHVARTQVVSHMAAQIRGAAQTRGSVNAAIKSAADKFSMSVEMVKLIWRDYCRSYDPHYGRKNWLERV
jgi:hypothetical protein